MRLLLGVWAAAVVGAVVLVTGVLVCWAAVEKRAFDRRRLYCPARRTPATPLDDHLAFARALTAVATAYLAECERQERER
jgi:hypothetical protein